MGDLMDIKVFYTPFLLDYKGNFPDVPDRLSSIINFLKSSDLRFDLVEPIKASEEDLLRVHSEIYVRELKEYKRMKSYFPDEDIDEKTFDILLWSAGTAISAAKSSLDHKTFGFGLTRPHGNHAGKQFFGEGAFVNNVSVAVARLLNDNDVKRPLILDFDAQFCSGTEDIFSKDDRVHLLSIHQQADTIYPKKGFERDSTKRMRYFENRLWITDQEFLDKFKGKVMDFVDDVKPDLIAVSAGFNIFSKDVYRGTTSKITNLHTFTEIGATLVERARKHHAAMFGVLEGGYWLDDLGKLVYHFLKGIETESSAGSFAVEPL